MRYYDINGRKMRSVTSILQAVAKPALVPWAAKVERELCVETACAMYSEVNDLGVHPPSPVQFKANLLQRLGKEKAHKRVLAKAADTGSDLHKLVEHAMRTEAGQADIAPPTVSDDALLAFEKFLAWRETVDLQPILIEQQVFSERHGYAGTMDLYCELDGRLAVLDWKTSRAIYRESHIQVSAYRDALIEMGHGDIVAGGVIVKLPKVAKDEVDVVTLTPEECDDLFGVFLHVKALSDWMEAK